MIYFSLIGHELHHEVQTMIQVFYPNRQYVQKETISPEGITVVSQLTTDFSRGYFYVDGELKGQTEVPCKMIEGAVGETKRVIKSALYLLLKEIVGEVPPWGIVTGIRPAKFVNELIDGGYSEEHVAELLHEGYFVQKPKIELALTVAQAERQILSGNQPGDYSLYIGIPFCPTRCLYCSFTSYSILQYGKMVDAYLDSLIQEMTYVAQHIQRGRLVTIYIGGGTPTALDASQLTRLLEALEELFDTKNVLEYTVEAGRPDTITKEKLQVLKKHSVNRISINPQTLNQKTLDLIGRNHTVEDVFRTYAEAQEAGFDNINMDLILGLPKESVEDVRCTMEGIQKLNPDSITLHTLAVKRASRLKEQFEQYALSESQMMEDMIALGKECAEALQMKPYYMYRQKNAVGNFENVGYCKTGKESVYNVQIMEEKQTIIALGAGGVTKIYDEKTNQLSRIFNVKAPEEYNGRLKEMLERKNPLFHGNFSQKNKS